jgi:hypothetical protein
MLEDFIREQEIDIFLKEVTQPIFENLRGNTAYANIGTNMQGTAILEREHMTLATIMRIPSGRGTAAELQECVW